MTTEQQPVPAATVPAAQGLRGIHPVLLLLTGIVCTAASAAFIKLSGTSAGTAAFFRCALALLVLVPLAVAEQRRRGSPGWHPAPLFAGVLLGIDYVFWSASIHEVGAAVATVLISIQIVVFPLLAWFFDKTPVARRFLVAAPVLLTGIVLASGITGGHAESGGDPAAGLLYGLLAGLAFAGYLYLMRIGSAGGSAITPVCTATATAALSSGVLGAFWGGIDLTPPWPALGWLIALALLGQILTWLLITTALPLLRPSTSATLLSLQPITAVAIGIGIGERPTTIQLTGCGLVVLTAYSATRRSRAEREP